MEKILAGWIGFTDIRASKGSEKDGFGPIGQAVKAREFDEICLISQNPRVDQDVLKEFFETATPLDHAIRSIIGMDAGVVNERFVEFITAHPALTSSQISFLNLLKNHISRYGSIAIEQLYEPPFTALHSNGLDGVFIDEDIIEELIGIIDTFLPKATAPKERPYDIH